MSIRVQTRQHHGVSRTGRGHSMTEHRPIEYSPLGKQLAERSTCHLGQPVSPKLIYRNEHH